MSAPSSNGVRLLGSSSERLRRTGWEPGNAVNPVMLVVTDKIESAEEVAALVESDDFMAGSYAKAVLTVHSDKSDEALAALDDVDDPDSPIRIIVSVGMLKEGWDAKNVYVIASLRPSISDMLTEQTLGRGLRLPFGSYTGREILDTVEVVAHERYEDLLRKKDILKEELVDHRTRMALRINAEGQQVAVPETTEVKPLFVIEGEEDSDGVGVVRVGSIMPFEERVKESEQALTQLKQQLAPVGGQSVSVPYLKATPIQAAFSMSDLTDIAPFRSWDVGTPPTPMTNWSEL